jgi:hypothetical protein
MASRVSTYTNSIIFTIFKVFPLLEIQVLHGGYNKHSYKSRDQRKVQQIYQTPDGREARLLGGAKKSAILDPVGSMCLIVDGMDQKTTMVPKMQQTAKSMESRFVKTHLCGILVNGVELYVDVWFNAHHYMIAIQLLHPLCMQLEMFEQVKGNYHPFFKSKQTIVDGKIRTSTCLVYVRL